MNYYTVRCKPKRKIVRRVIRGRWMRETLECGHELQRGIGTPGDSNLKQLKRVCWECRL